MQLAQAASATPPAGQNESDKLSRQEIEKLVAPVALYSDALLAQVLAASAYPVEIVEAARWVERNKEQIDKSDYSGLDSQKWDASVKAIARFPTVLKKMSEELAWTSDLGAAYLEQPTDVADVIQDLRARAEKTGVLKDTPQQRVVRRRQADRDVIIVEPVVPTAIYVPVYDPLVVFGPVIDPALALGLVTFGSAIVLGAYAMHDYWNWPAGLVYPPYWPGYPHWRPGWRPPGLVRHWQPDTRHFRPMVSAHRRVANKASLAKFKQVTHRARLTTRGVQATRTHVVRARPQAAVRAHTMRGPALYRQPARFSRGSSYRAPRYVAPRYVAPRYHAPVMRGGGGHFRRR